MGDAEQIVAKVIGNISSVDAAEWNACANPSTVDPDCGIPDNPFTSHEFLRALEESGSATARTGWSPHHVVIEDAAGSIVGAVAMYLKNHSYGEYVFDHSWAHAFERAGGSYYPKLQCSVPFTPATGRRLLARPGPDAVKTEEQLLASCVEVARRLDVSSLHFTFLPEEQWRRLGEAGLLQRTDQQFHWENKGYGTFDEFLENLSSRKRKQIRRERRDATANGIDIETLTGDDLKEEHWDAFFHFYMDTGSRKWGAPYLTREFFSLINERMPHQTALVMCSRNGRYIAGALNFIGGDTLFGRNWGAIEHHKFLHFEACYYQAIEFAISRGLKRVEAGAQGAHKLVRGYMPTRTHSAHWIADPNFRDAVARFLQEERRYVDADIEEMKQYGPFKKGGYVFERTPARDDEQDEQE